MKITAKILFGGLLMGGLLSACHPSSPNKGGSTPSGADSAYISFSLDCPQGILREGGGRSYPSGSFSYPLHLRWE